MTHRDRNERETTGSPPAASARGPLGNALLAGGCAVIVVLAGALTLLLMTGGDDSAANDGVKRAVIVDQLSLTQPNPDFLPLAARPRLRSRAPARPCRDYDRSERDDR